MTRARDGASHMWPIPKDNHHEGLGAALKDLPEGATWRITFLTAQWGNSQHGHNREGAATTV